MKKKPESKSAGALKDEDFVPWNGITLNRCLAVAAIAALLSVGFQILQETDDIEETENEVWTPPESSDNPSEPWFYEGWFGSSTIDSAIKEEPEEEPEESDAPDPEIPDVTEEQKESDEPEPPAVDGETETEKESLKQEPIELKKREESKEKQKTVEQWGLKPKSKYMEYKGVKIRTASEDGPKKDVFPFNLSKKPKDTPKPFSGEKEKSYKNEKYQKKYEEKKYDYPKKQDYEKSFKKEFQFSKQDRGKKENKDYKGYKVHHFEKDYKKKYNP